VKVAIGGETGVMGKGVNVLRGVAVGIAIIVARMAGSGMGSGPGVIGIEVPNKYTFPV